MSRISKSALVPYSAAQMFALVDDINAYPQFLPWCRSSSVLSRNDDEVRATIEMARGKLHKSFTTHNRLQQDKMIEIRLVDGPFKHLDGYWRFENMGEHGSKVLMDLNYEISSTVLRLAIGPVFSQIANSLVDAFVQRATSLYGPAGS